MAKGKHRRPNRAAQVLTTLAVVTLTTLAAAGAESFSGSSQTVSSKITARTLSEVYPGSHAACSVQLTAVERATGESPGRAARDLGRAGLTDLAIVASDAHSAPTWRAYVEASTAEAAHLAAFCGTRTEPLRPAGSTLGPVSRTLHLGEVTTQ
jgi:hypothetical protein